MSDIVERLRKRMVRRELGDDPLVKVFGDAADEIERLRLNVFGLAADNEAKSDIIRELHDEIERLTTLLAASRAEIEETMRMQIEAARQALGEAKDE
jgi:hypothetical protein